MISPGLLAEHAPNHKSEILKSQMKLRASAEQKLGDVVMPVGSFLHERSQAKLKRKHKQGNEYLDQEFNDRGALHVYEGIDRSLYQLDEDDDC